jgi:hypothetical protein
MKKVSNLFCGIWKCVDEDSFVRVEIKNTRSGAIVRAYDVDDGEEFRLVKIKFTPLSVGYDYIVPSNGHHAKQRFVLKQEGFATSALTLVENWGKDDDGQGALFDGVWKCIEGNSAARVVVSNSSNIDFDVNAFNAETGEVFEISRVKSTPRTISFDRYVPSCDLSTRHKLVFRNDALAKHILTVFETWKKVTQ